MSRYKRLDCPKHIQYSLSDFTILDCWEFPKRIPPVFNKNGWYLDREKNISWCEWEGKGYKQSVEEFKNTLYFVSIEPIRDVVFNALKILVYNKISNKEIRDMFYKEQYRREARETFKRSIWKMHTKKRKL